ncbi:PP2C family protein-serine/threonine phosphatase [Aliiruegeria haliotis]|nr:protein phosphatase 2C domain-containing protein [Aliiruegeria haliotis]
MSPPSELCLDAATGLSLGARESQEDAVLCDVPRGGGAGFVVLADGLGGHVAGALASRLAVATALDELARQRAANGRLEGEIPGLLVDAALAANHAILSHAEANPETAGMGATLLLVVVQDSALHWLSIGDSPFYLLRDAETRQLNEVHSLAPQFDFLAAAGELDPEVAANHPDRSCLTSALGQDPLRQIDCPLEPFPLRAGDVLLAASDGILTLSERAIRDGLASRRNAAASDLVGGLMGRVEDCDAMGQDNLSVAVLRVLASDKRAARAPRSERGGLMSWLGLDGIPSTAGVGHAFRAQFDPPPGGTPEAERGK